MDNGLVVKETSPLLKSNPTITPTPPNVKFHHYGSANDVGISFQNDKIPHSLKVSHPSLLYVQDPTHCHQNERKETSTMDRRARKTLIIASVLCLAFMVAEVIGGYIASSLAIMTDAAHLLTDFASFMISLFSLFLAARPATRRMSFGWHRAEVIGALVSVLLIWVITGVLVYIAVERIINKQFDVDGEVMLITAAVGVGVNLIMGFVLHRGGAHGHSHGGISHGHGHSHDHESGHQNAPEHGHDHGHVEKRQRGHSITGSTEILIIDSEGSEDLEKNENKSKKGRNIAPANINVRAAFIHVIGDFLQSLGVLVAALVIYFKPHLGIIDPICTFIFSVLVLVTTIAIMRDALNVLMEGLPRGIDFVEVTESLLALDGVERVHDLRIWSLTMDKTALAVHLAVNSDWDAQVVLKKAREVLRRRFNIFECTIQIEWFTDDMNECLRCEVPKK